MNLKLSRQFITTIILLLLNIQFTIAQKDTLNGLGSDTMLPLMAALASNYGTPEEQVLEVEGGGSSLGFKGLDEYQAEFALSSRKVRSNEKTDIENNYDQLIEKVIAYDALSIIVHPSNPINKLTMKQLKGIFTGEIKNWSELGGEDLPIQVVTRDQYSGSYGFMTSVVIQSEKSPADVKEVHSNAGVVDKVSKIRGAIGYCGIAYVEEVVQPLSISSQPSNFVYPSFRNALNKQYPLSRPLYLYYRGSDKRKVQDFVNFALSDKGQQIIAHKGYIPVL
ncbi:PstS family phosphate ABC transporter substrate-binding protein [Flammeovirga sp. SubArs3]|uniref:PstS family phosphate ABC transporter substrate-binding protein n=1 Tax=Flammeovirga sp. SubArs3 TaxID=2995316 RepID=UPI00248C2452|nr:PstS family phosphate ABC transporter substrate-binding protein [Flammeovirga sp. SubArs3]